MKLNIPGDTSEGVTPVPIPNTEVKSFSAENTCYSFAGKIGHCQDSEKRSELLGTLFLLRINCPKSKAVEKPLHEGITIMQGLNEFMVVA